ncbi:Ppx/GppA phosphatase family protein [Mycobacterium haemophilum]|uniref:Exopolyphosphatase 2 n=1 Tax=Mycobacterium haemophilum TaxID=29311 RepID=A0A0I9VJ90_9MYCO|nr:Ppx/GppA phosphatase family protein [Mycobacterium haemophilum]KLO32447.1 exopolyphosphatase [Mycobacterium haemophilum]KLO38661.1 exopolyphosphatase [Mycobacterium haemophilum]KLO44996.1 exopolyphosphatase [Mycobacterium haemophilum]KLO56340.1 exopolyphosphatase [Mycobacterium haemophilum]
MSRVAAIDCGTNSIRLLIADLQSGSAGGQLRDVHREMRIVRLGQGVDATGEFAPDAIARTRGALADYAALLSAHRVERVRMVATSAARDVANRDVFFAMTADVLGAVIPGSVAEVITGAEEAELSFRGAVGELDSAGAPFVVVDLGGGSTEIVLGGGSAGRGAVASYSADIGCVRLTERCLHSDPPTPEEVAAARQLVRERLDVALQVVPVEHARTWVGLAGTMTTLSALAQNMTTYDAAAIHLSRVCSSDLLAVCDRLIGMTRMQRVALPPMHEGRADVIGGGAIVVQELARELRTRAGIDELTVSEHDILDGIALSIAG